MKKQTIHFLILYMLVVIGTATSIVLFVFSFAKPLTAEVIYQNSLQTVVELKADGKTITTS